MTHSYTTSGDLTIARTANTPNINNGHRINGVPLDFVLHRRARNFKFTLLTS